MIKFSFQPQIPWQSLVLYLIVSISLCRYISFVSVELRVILLVISVIFALDKVTLSETLIILPHGLQQCRKSIISSDYTFTPFSCIRNVLINEFGTQSYYNAI